MGINKRDFLKIAGVTAIGAAVGPSRRAAAALRGKVTNSPNALTAKRWAMVVDMKKCKGDCSDCISACHRAHSVPSIPNPRHEIKWIWQDQYANVFEVPEDEVRLLADEVREKPFIVLCNHCDNPPCVRACPTQATFKRKSDGIVMMDFHRCIGCRFCMAACPYGSRSFNFQDPRKYLKAEDINPAFPTRMKGVVEKCNFCSERLASGLPPACVEACKQGVLTFGDLDDPNSEVSRLLKENYTVKRKPELGTMPMVYYIV
jgi:Fe-S-cluster-containing dehydrogenase component